MAQPAEHDRFELHVGSGRLHVERTGPRNGPVVLCVHGLSANVRGFDRVIPQLATRGHRAVGVDLRGRGRSEVTPPGTYGLEAHARDLIALADALEVEAFDYAGWSLGALIGMALAGLAPGRVRRMVLIDHAAAVDPGPATAVRAGLLRLDAVVADPEDYVKTLRARLPIAAWDPFWDAYFGYELARREDGRWSPSTDRAACEEDMDGIEDAEDLRARWAALTMPTLLVRCTAPIAGGLIVPSSELGLFRATVAGARVVEVDSDHYGVMTDVRAIAAIAEHLAS